MSSETTIKATDRVQLRIEAAYLAECSPEAAYSWLRANEYTHEYPPDFLAYGSTPDVLERVLTQRKDPIIDLGIARFGRARKAIRKVFNRGNIGVRCAALSNPHIGPELDMIDGWLKMEDLKEIINHGARAELESLTCNRHLHPHSIEALITRTYPFDDLPDSQYFQMLTWLLNNPRLAYNTSTADFHEGWDWFNHTKIFSLVWDLARHWPTTQKNAQLLQALLWHTTPPIDFDKVDEVIARWKIEQNSDTLWPSHEVRSRLADLLKADEDLLTSDDAALKQSFYRRFNVHEFSDWPERAYEDGEVVFYALCNNKQLWTKWEHRDQLFALAGKLDDDTAARSSDDYEYTRRECSDTYNDFYENYHAEYPEWFMDNDPPFEAVSEPTIHDLQGEIDRLVSIVQAADKDRRFDHTLDDLIRYEIKEIEERLNIILKQRLNELHEELSRLIIKNAIPRNNGWLWFAIIILTGLLLTST